MTDAFAVVLAAGSSVRMGDTNKLLLNHNGTALVRQAAMSFIDARTAGCTVVTGFEHAKVSDALKGLPVNLVFNAEHKIGQASSVLFGLQCALESADNKATPHESASKQSSCFIVGLSDQPLLQAHHIVKVVKAYEYHANNAVTSDGRSCRALVPTVDGQRGNPVVLSYSLVQALVQSKTSPRDYLNAHPNEVVFEPFEDDAFVFDVDTEFDWDRLTNW